jgi:hypothetical protein
LYHYEYVEINSHKKWGSSLPVEGRNIYQPSVNEDGSMP